MKYIIGIDAGGTSSKGASYQINGELIKEEVVGFGNFAVDIIKTKLHLEELINKLIEPNKNNELKAIYLGVAGIGSFPQKDQYLKELELQYSTKVKLMSDIALTKQACLKGNNGIMFILGTGFACIGSNDNKELLFGGWGHIIGDHCSGYALGIAAIRKVIFDYENQSFSELSKNILDFFEIDDVMKLKEITYQYPKDKVASIAKLIIELSFKNKDALEILTLEITKLAETLERLITALNFKKEVNIVGFGSIFENIPMLKEILEANLYAYQLNWLPKKEATLGAYYLYHSKEKRVVL
jgi:Predicted N-acetylglucosamine kinase